MPTNVPTQRNAMAELEARLTKRMDDQDNKIDRRFTEQGDKIDAILTLLRGKEGTSEQGLLGRIVDAERTAKNADCEANKHRLELYGNGNPSKGLVLRVEKIEGVHGGEKKYRDVVLVAILSTIGATIGTLLLSGVFQALVHSLENLK